MLPIGGAATTAGLPLARYAQARAITWHSPIRIRNKQLQPHGSESSRPRGFVLRWRRDGASYHKESRGFATLASGGESLCGRRARPDLFTRSALRRSISAPNSRPSLCLKTAGLHGGCSRFRSQPRRVGFGERRQRENIRLLARTPATNPLRLPVLRTNGRRYAVPFSGLFGWGYYQ
jgi:hypothetical protein